MHKAKEVINDYRKKMQTLNDQVIRTRAHYLKLIKKESVGHLIRQGHSEFEALELLEKLNDFSITCHKFGSLLKCMSC